MCTVLFRIERSCSVHVRPISLTYAMGNAVNRESCRNNHSTGRVILEVLYLSHSCTHSYMFGPSRTTCYVLLFVQYSRDFLAKQKRNRIREQTEYIE